MLDCSGLHSRFSATLYRLYRKGPNSYREASPAAHSENLRLHWNVHINIEDCMYVLPMELFIWNVFFFCQVENAPCEFLAIHGDRCVSPNAAKEFPRRLEAHGMHGKHNYKVLLYPGQAIWSSPRTVRMLMPPITLCSVGVKAYSRLAFKQNLETSCRVSLHEFVFL